MNLQMINWRQSSYNKSVTCLFVDTNEEPKAGQVVEFVNWMQAGWLCAIVRGAEAIIDMTNPLAPHHTWLLRVRVRISVVRFAAIVNWCCNGRCPRFVGELWAVAWSVSRKITVGFIEASYSVPVTLDSAGSLDNSWIALHNCCV